MHFGLSRARSRIEIQIQVCKLNLESLMGLCDWKKGILRPKTDKPSLGQIYGICGSTACERGLPGGSEGEGMPLLQSCENRLLWSKTASLGKIELHFAKCRQKFDFLQQTQCLSKLLHKRISNKYENFPAKCVNHVMLGPKINKFQHLNPIEIWEGLNVLVKFALSLLNNLSTLPKATQISLKLH